MKYIFDLTKMEKITYFFIWIFAVIYSIYQFASISFKSFKNYIDEYNDFTEGISFLKERRDKADMEWEIIIHLVKLFFPWIFLYLFIAEIWRYYNFPKMVAQLWQIFFTLAYVKISAGYIFVAILIFQPFTFCITRYLSKKNCCTWYCSGASLILLSSYKTLGTSEKFLSVVTLNEYESYMITVGLCWMNLKCTSFYLEQPMSTDIVEFFSYCLYPPTVFAGPFILHEDFQNIYKSNEYNPVYDRLKKLVKNILKCLFWFLFANICLHFIYVNATMFQPKLVENFDSWSLYGFGYTMGQFFHIKYVVLYGLSTSFTSFENVNVPRLPRCIGRIHLYSDMWKYFDPGLYKFLLRHIYLPCLRISSYKLIASLLCFTFVYVWHGLENYILIWTMLNYIGVIIESAFEFLIKKELVNQTDMNKLFWTKRMKCILSAPLLAMSAISNFFFFAGTEIGTIFFRRILTGGLSSNLILLFLLYCCCQVSMELRSKPASKM